MLNSVDNAKRRVLIVDDQFINRELLGLILGDPYDPLFAENGQEAMELIYQHREVLSCILLDLSMPVMDGFEVMRRWDADESIRNIPIIVLTAEKSAELKSLQMGAADFITKPFDATEVIQARVARIIELSERRSIIKAAERDELTGLYTENFFYEYAQRIDRYNEGRVMDAVALNIERFHMINELYGRDFGDKLLSAIGASIAARCTADGGIACRENADSFLLYIPHTEEHDQERDLLANALSGLDSSAHIRLRTGIYPAVDKSLSVMHRFDRAKSACSMLRGSTRSVLVYDEAMHEKELFAEGLVNDIHRAIEEKEFQVYYQPKYRIQGEKPTLGAAEALIRWKHPVHGMVSPGAFIPLFESNGMIQLVDYYVWKETARQIADWKKRFGFSVPVSVNLSRVDMYDPELEDKLLALVRDNGLDMKDMHLEVTESAYTDNVDEIIQIVTHLRDLGFEIELDDFGAGYSSLNMLSTLPIDVLKLDMKFIQNVKDGNDKDFRLIELILDIADWLRVPVVAEGVETEEQCRLLKEAGCALVQGYYFSKPVPAEDFERFIKAEL